MILTTLPLLKKIIPFRLTIRVHYYNARYDVVEILSTYFDIFLLVLTVHVLKSVRTPNKSPTITINKSK